MHDWRHNSLRTWKFVHCRRSICIYGWLDRKTQFTIDFIGYKNLFEFYSHYIMQRRCVNTITPRATWQKCTHFAKLYCSKVTPSSRSKPKWFDCKCAKPILLNTVWNIGSLPSHTFNYRSCSAECFIFPESAIHLMAKPV